jgi:VanZ family protein
MALHRSYRFLSVVAWLGVVGWASVIYYLSSLTGYEVEQALPMAIWDKALHFAAFSTGAFLLAAALRVSAGWGWRIILPLTLVLVSLYGWSDEWHQQFTPGRSGLDLGDWTADSLGGIGGSLVCCACSGWTTWRRRKAVLAGATQMT